MPKYHKASHGSNLTHCPTVYAADGMFPTATDQYLAGSTTTALFLEMIHQASDIKLARSAEDKLPVDSRMTPGIQPKIERQMLIKKSAPQPVLMKTESGGKNNAKKYRQMSDCNNKSATIQTTGSTLLLHCSIARRPRPIPPEHIFANSTYSRADFTCHFRWFTRSFSW